MDKKKIDLAYSIRGTVVTIVSMFSDNVQHWIREPLKVLLIMNEEKMLQKGVLTDRELNVSAGRKLITTPMDANDNIIETDKLACGGS